MLYDVGVKYEDFRYPIDTTTYARPEFDAAKAKGEFAIAMDKVPILEINGTERIGQSKAIERYLSQKFGFFGSTLEEGAKIDMLCEHIIDIKKAYADARVGKADEELVQAKLKFMAETLPTFFSKLDKVLASEQFAVGSKLSLADIVIQQFVNDYFDDKEGALKATSGCSKVVGISNHVTAAAKGWLDSRPVTKI